MTGGAGTPLSAAADLAARFAEWSDFLQHEKRFSRHTLRAYTKDVSEFFAFLTQHAGRPPSMNDFAAVTLADFRSWLSARTRAGAGA